jgi:hypothetical protein
MTTPLSRRVISDITMPPASSRHCQVNVDHGHVWCCRDAEHIKPLPRCSTR